MGQHEMTFAHSFSPDLPAPPEDAGQATETDAAPGKPMIEADALAAHAPMKAPSEHWHSRPPRLTPTSPSKTDGSHSRVLAYATLPRADRIAYASRRAPPDQQRDERPPLPPREALTPGLCSIGPLESLTPSSDIAAFHHLRRSPMAHPESPTPTPEVASLGTLSPPLITRVVLS